MRSGTVDYSRSIVITFVADIDLDPLISSWLHAHHPTATFSLAAMASPVRDGGVEEFVLALDGLAITEMESLLRDLNIDPEHMPFSSRR